MSRDKRHRPGGGGRSRIDVVGKLPFLPALIAAMLRFLYRTCHITTLGREHEDFVKGLPGPGIATCWHFAFPTVVYHYRDLNVVTMASRSRDGELAARVAERLGMRCFRGSPGKGGGAALKGLIDALQSSYGGGFIADGSQGPPRIAQKGILLLARYSGAPILPVSIAARPCWRFRSWDRTVLPKPFARIVAAFGPPLIVQRDVSPERLEELRLELEASLNNLTRDAQRALGLPD
ncbi:lysophospholipid acyltransferase family protein [Syntrophobacter fumaroxidans]|nr:lysophospholipid acyltransferase family protein [Syntrophobacter fumaroxidans]